MDPGLERFHPWLCRVIAITQMLDIDFLFIKDSFQKSGASYGRGPGPFPLKSAGLKMSSTVVCQFLLSHQVPFPGIIKQMNLNF